VVWKKELDDTLLKCHAFRIEAVKAGAHYQIKNSEIIQPAERSNSRGPITINSRFVRAEFLTDS